MKKLNELIKYPVKYFGACRQIFDTEGHVILDIRGWGRLQYDENHKYDEANGIKKQDFIGEEIAKAINMYLTMEEK